MDHSQHEMTEMDHMSHHNHDQSPDVHVQHMHSVHDMLNGTEDMGMNHAMRAGADHSAHAHHGTSHSMTGMSHDMSGMSHNMSGMHDMSMTFHGGYNETILFSWWKVTDGGEFAGSFFAIFIMALLYEGLKYYRKHLLWKTYHGLQYCAVAPPDKGVANVCATDDPTIIQQLPHTLERNIPTMLSSAHALQTGLHGLQVLVSYMLMLVFMTYNVWLCAAVVFGSAAGYFLFGWRESVVVDFTEHCH
ncbi:hypothetical protein O0L34_g12553 [Tuta absoluta]|nr:hypothetical protein O0L34_g12553 [Tuta absoluta]